MVCHHDQHGGCFCDLANEEIAGLEKQKEKLEGMLLRHVGRLDGSVPPGELEDIHLLLADSLTVLGRDVPQWLTEYLAAHALPGPVSAT